MIGAGVRDPLHERGPGQAAGRRQGRQDLQQARHQRGRRHYRGEKKEKKIISSCTIARKTVIKSLQQKVELNGLQLRAIDIDNKLKENKKCGGSLGRWGGSLWRCGGSLGRCDGSLG